jgi:hypothetical protein
MVKNVVVTVLAIVLMAGSATAAGLRMGPSDIQQNDTQAAAILADRIDAALKADPSGHAYIKEMVNGRERNSCTTPLDYMNGINGMYGNRIATLDQLANYIRHLQAVQNAAQHYPGMLRMSWMEQVSGGCRLRLDGWTRRLQVGETAFIDPSTSQLIFAGACGNLIWAPPPPPPLPPPPPGAPPGIVWGIIKCAMPTRSACRDEPVIINNGGVRVSPNIID